MRFIFAIAISVLATSSFGKEPSQSGYSIQFIAQMSDGKYFEGTAVCKKEIYCEIRFGKNFGINIVDDKKSYSLFIVDYNRYSLPCCSFSNGKGYFSFEKFETKKAIDFYQTVDDDLTFRRSKKIGDLYLMISEYSKN